MRVVVTRPEPGASRTADRLRADGYEPVLIPLTRIAPLPAPSTAPHGFDAVAVTSSNALRHAGRQWVTGLTTLPCFAVGTETARLAAKSGFSNIHDAAGDAAALSALIAMRLPPGARILYLCGRLRRPTFETALAEQGFVVTALETYETLPTDAHGETLARHLAEADIVLVHSQEAAITLERLVGAGSADLSRLLFLCISQRVAAVLSRQGHKTIAATEPTEASMLSALRDISPGGT